MKPTQEEVQIEVKKLRHMQQRLPARDVFGSGNRRTVAVQIDILEGRMSKDALMDKYGDWGEETDEPLVTRCNGAFAWLNSTSMRSPSALWLMDYPEVEDAERNEVEIHSEFDPRHYVRLHIGEQVIEFTEEEARDIAAAMLAAAAYRENGRDTIIGALRTRANLVDFSLVDRTLRIEHITALARIPKGQPPRVNLGIGDGINGVLGLEQARLVRSALDNAIQSAEHGEIGVYRADFLVDGLDTPRVHISVARVG